MKIGNNLMIGFENEWRQIRKMTGYRFRLITLEYQFYKFTHFNRIIVFGLLGFYIWIYFTVLEVKE